jgi:hypothetical protein
MSVQSGSAIHVIRFYLPALGVIALLGAWVLVELFKRGLAATKWAPAVILVALMVAAGWTYRSLATTGGRIPSLAPPTGPLWHRTGRAPGSAPHPTPVRTARADLMISNCSPCQPGDLPDTKWCRPA